MLKPVDFDHFSNETWYITQQREMGQGHFFMLYFLVIFLVYQLERKIQPMLKSRENLHFALSFKLTLLLFENPFVPNGVYILKI